jgi:hypothetical protein
MSSITLWSSITLSVAKFIEGTFIDGLSIVWAIGVPFIALIVVTQKNTSMEAIILSTNKFTNGNNIYR